MAQEFDLVILGGGTGGYVAAIRASQLGLKTAIVESDKLGGTCLHKGCIPSKALLRSAEVYKQSKIADSFGIELNNPTVNFSKVQSRKNNVVESLHKGVQGLMKKGKIEVFSGYGRILGPSIFSPSAGTISVEMNDGSENEMLLPKNVLIATGSKPKDLPGLETDGVSVLNSDHALELEQLPQSIVIVGGGVIGIEWASMLADFDVEVTVVEHADQILPNQDEAITKEATRLLKKKGITVLTSAKVLPETLNKDKGIEIEVTHKGTNKKLNAEKLLVSVGRKPNVQNIGIQNTDIELTEQGFIKTNQYYQTKESHIYAIGDCIGGLQLAHVASREGTIAVEHITGQTPTPLNDSNVPTCVYSKPEVASIGLTEKQALDKGYDIKTAKMSFKAIGKALVFGESDGFVKMISDSKTNDLLGVHMIGPHVTDLISEVSLAKLLDATPWEISESIHPHPSLSEVFGEVALSIEGRQVHG